VADAVIEANSFCSKLIEKASRQTYAACIDCRLRSPSKFILLDAF
jgi:hypothetical protein